MKTSVQSSTILVSENFSKHFGTRNCKTFNSGRVMIDCIHSHINKIHELKIFDTVLEEILKRNSKSLTNNPALISSKLTKTHQHAVTCVFSLNWQCSFHQQILCTIYQHHVQSKCQTKLGMF